MYKAIRKDKKKLEKMYFNFLFIAKHLKLESNIWRREYLEKTRLKNCDEMQEWSQDLILFLIKVFNQI